MKSTRELRTSIFLEERIRQVLALLEREYGAPGWQTRSDALSVLVQTILSQNTSDANSRNAFESLLSFFHNWESVASADVATIAHRIRYGGLGRVKAQYIKSSLQGILRERGKLELDFLKELGLPSAERWLCRLPGVGLKTARCVLLFSLGMPALPVDTHIWRVSKRLGLIDCRASLLEAHYALGGAVPPDCVYQFHILVIEHGRRVCRARHPECRGCMLKHLCPAYLSDAESP